MRRLTRGALALIGAGALVVGGAPAALADHPTTVEVQDPATGTWSAYSGEVKATNTSNVTLTGFSPLGLVVTTCTTGELIADVDSDGHNGALTGVTLDNCTNNYGGSTTITANGLPYADDGSGGEAGGVVYDTSGGHSGYIYIASPNPNVDIEAHLDINQGSPLVCHFGVTDGNDLTIDVDNGSPSTGALNGESLQLLPGSDGNCPGSASATGSFDIVAHPSGNNVRITS